MTDASSTPPSPKPRLSRRLRWLLIGSLTLNVLVLGSVAGMGLRHFGPDGPGPGHERMAGFGPWGGALTHEDYKQLRQAFDAEGYDFRADRRAEREDRQLMLSGLRANPYDPAALQQIIARQEARATARMAMGNRLILEHVGGLTPEARRAVAERMEAAGRKGPRRPPPQD